MSKKKRTDILEATAEELRLIATLTASPVFERLDDGELEIVDADDWSDVPEIETRVSLRIPKDLYRRLSQASRRRRTTPERLAARWLAQHVG